MQYREIDLSAGIQPAKELVNKSGRQSVSQEDINGRIITGFDKKKNKEIT